MKLTNEQKDEIRLLLQNYVARYPSQNKAANSLVGISAGTLSTILNGRYETISDDMFTKLRAQIAGQRGEDWQLSPTMVYQELSMLLTDAQEYQNVAWAVAPAGAGKTTTIRDFAARHENVFVVSCSEDMRRGDFIREMARVIGLKLAQTSLREKLQAVTDELRVLDRPLLVFDEGDKLMDTVFYYFISIYNALEGRCGIIFLSTEYIKRRMSIGLEYDKKGYDEMFSRIGRRFIDLTPATSHEVTAVCLANGLNAEAAISKVLADARTVVSKAANPWDKKQVQDYYDMRRVRKSVHKSKKLAEIKK